jgi:hypothetical protein
VKAIDGAAGAGVAAATDALGRSSAVGLTDEPAGDGSPAPGLDAEPVQAVTMTIVRIVRKVSVERTRDTAAASASMLVRIRKISYVTVATK